ncbi:MAG: 3-hydroxybutyrate dehydrogenase [Janthinobacterium lividum]
MLKDKIAFVTGSTSGIGLGIARTLASQGCHIMLNGFGDPADIEQIQKTIESDFNIKCDYSAADMSKANDIQAMIAQTESKFGGLDILVNNAGIQFTSPIEKFPAEKWQSILAINLSASFYSMQAAVPIFQKRGWGRIINIASAHGLVASVEKSAYVAAKHGLVGLTKVVALENAPANITCNAICPGWVYTPLVEKQIKDRAAQEGIDIAKATKELLEEKQPSLRFVQPEHLGEMVLFLCSEAGSSITGTALSMDGGWTAQ